MEGTDDAARRLPVRGALTDLGDAVRPTHPRSRAAALDIHGVVGHVELAYARLLDAHLMEFRVVGAGPTSGSPGRS